MLSLLLAVLLFAAELPDYTAKVIRVIDGDTIEMEVNIWPGLYTRTSVRVRGIDTPEKRQPKCPEEKALGFQASAFTAKLMPAGAKVTISGVQADKYGSRIDATVKLPDGGDLGAALINAGLAKPYDGGTKSSWCAQ